MLTKQRIVRILRQAMKKYGTEIAAAIQQQNYHEVIRLSRESQTIKTQLSSILGV